MSHIWRIALFFILGIAVPTIADDTSLKKAASNYIILHNKLLFICKPTTIQDSNSYTELVDSLTLAGPVNTITAIHSVLLCRDQPSSQKSSDIYLELVFPMAPEGMSRTVSDTTLRDGFFLNHGITLDILFSLYEENSSDVLIQQLKEDLEKMRTTLQGSSSFRNFCVDHDLGTEFDDLMHDMDVALGYAAASS